MRRSGTWLLLGALTFNLAGCGGGIKPGPPPANYGYVEPQG